jgi:hypothetical protein
MKPLRCILIISLALLNSSVSPSQDKPQQSSSGSGETAQTSSRGVITGRVVSDDGQPLANINVNAYQIGGRQGRSVRADAEGRFQLDGLSRGIYRLSAYTPGYVSEQENVSWPDGKYYRPGDSATIRLIRGGVITGRALNATGEPMSGIPVAVMRVRAGEDRIGQRIQSGRPSLTDDRGIYRIYGLAPGSYVVYAGGGGAGFGYANPFASDARTYFPSSTHDAAAEVSVQAGIETTGIDIRWRGERGYAISGTIKTTGSEPSRRRFIQVDLFNALTGAHEASGFYQPGAASNGFALYGVSDGEYDLIATANDQDQGARSQPRRITVSGRDITGIELTLLPLGSIAGKVILENVPAESRAKACQSSRPASLEEMLISVSRDQSERDERQDYLSYGRSTSPNSQGEFMIKVLAAGRWRLALQLFDDRWYVKAITRSVSEPKPPARAIAPAAALSNDPGRNGLLLKSGEQVSDLTVTLAEGAAALRGKVVAENSKLPARLQVQLVPAEKDSADDLLRYQETQAASDGAFSLGNLAPGKYWLLIRSVTDNDSAERQSRPLFRDSSERAKLRREAEAANIVIELQPCQRVTDFTVKPKSTVKD